MTMKSCMIAKQFRTLRDIKVLGLNFVRNGPKILLKLEISIYPDSINTEYYIYASKAD